MPFPKKSFLILLMAFLAINSFSQDLESWSIYSSFSTVNSLTIDTNGELYAATLGGIFTVSEGEISKTYTTIDGLHRLDPSYSVLDELNNKIIFAYPDGVIDLFDIEEGTFEKNEDIARVNQFSSKKINDLLIHENELYVATDFGIVIFDLNGFFVTTSILKVGEFDRGIQINDIDISDNIIYCATSRGVAIADLNNNLLNSDSWSNYSEAEGFENSITKKVTAFNSNVYAISGDSVYSLNNEIWSLTNEFGSNSISEFNKNGDVLYAVSGQQILIRNISSSDEVLNINTNSTILSLLESDGLLHIGTSNEGILTIDLDNTNNVFQSIPEGPYLNFFSKMKYVNNTLISTSTIAFPQSDPFNPVRGYYLFNEGEWSNYNIRTSEELNSFGFGSIFSLSNTSNDYYFGGWGRGIVKHTINTNEITVFNASNTGLTGVTPNRNFVVISGLGGDSNDNMWAVSFDSNFPLNLQQAGSDEWLNFPKVSIPSDNLYFDLFVDSKNQKWISLTDFSYNGKGLLVMDTNDITDSSDDEYRKLTANNANLPDELITSIIEDKNGEVWIGTARGIARFIFPEFIIESTNPNDYQAQWLINEDTSAISRFLLRDVNVSAMAVNEANQKWIGSVNQGLWLLNEEGSRIEKRFTTENSPLISNNILSITINDETGEVFIATDLGLISYSDLAITPKRKMEELKVFPNPFLYERHSQVVIEGLSESTEIKVLGVDGTVVQEIETKGGRVSWDGMDYNGNKLGTGVYFIVALEKGGAEKGIGKVVIIK